jgi:hypothetical protein
MALRISLCTGCPIRLNISLTSWVLPSPTTTRHQEFIPEAVGRTSSSPCGITRCPSMTVPRASLTRSSGSGTPRTLARYSRNTPYLGWATRRANSPSLVRITKPSEW